MTLLSGEWAACAAAVLLSAGAAKETPVSVLKQRAETLAKAAQALANPRGCKTVDECRVEGFGAKSCGGPRTYVAYCAKTTKVKELQAKLSALEKAEREWQAAAGIMSTCGLTRRPQPWMEEGVCFAR